MNELYLITYYLITASKIKTNLLRNLKMLIVTSLYKQNLVTWLHKPTFIINKQFPSAFISSRKHGQQKNGYVGGDDVGDGEHIV